MDTPEFSIKLCIRKPVVLSNYHAFHPHIPLRRDIYVFLVSKNPLMTQKLSFCVIGGFFGQRLKTTASFRSCSACFQPSHRGWDLTQNLHIVSAIFSWKLS